MPIVARKLPVAMACAITASIVAHLALVTVAFTESPGAGKSQTRPLLAALAAVEVMPSLETLPETRYEPMLRPSPEPLSTLKLPLQPSSFPAEPSATAQQSVSEESAGHGQAVGTLLLDRSRLGTFHDRGMSEFPVEVDVPVRLTGKIVARYPPAALAARREDSVAAWVVVNEQGRASEIEIAEGTEEFGDQVRLAIREARFQPAEDKLKPIRFPIALQFDFRLDAASGTAATQK